jgi:hypothetical protein
LRYAEARKEQVDREDAYRIYMSDLLMGFTGAKRRYADLVMRRTSEPTESADEIINRIQTQVNAFGGVQE